MSDVDAATLDAFPFGEFDKYVDIGERHWYAMTSCRAGCGPDNTHGIIQPHFKPDGSWCGGAVTFRGHDPGKRMVDGQWVPGPTWDVVSLEPLDLNPSLQCTVCPDHGFIHGGRWASA